MNQHPPEPTQVARGPIIKRAALGFVAAVLALVALFFLPAGTFDYWQAWLYLATLLTPVVALGIYLALRDPELLERRMRTRETELRQQRVIRIAMVCFIAGFLLPGFDRRFGWSQVPPWVVIVADGVVLLGYALFVRVLLANRFASRVIEVMPDQPVISSGPYAVVRHPMYVAMLLIWLASPIALGSWWGVLPLLTIVPILVLRIADEEAMLRRDLPGYAAYCAKVRYRLLPGIW